MKLHRILRRENTLALAPEPAPPRTPIPRPLTYAARSAALLCAVLLVGGCSEERKPEGGAQAAGHEETLTDLSEKPDSAVTGADSVLAETTVVPAATPVPEPDTAAYAFPGPRPLPGAILPHKRILAYYGNPLSTRMGILGEFPPEVMLQKLDEEVAKWAKADSLTPVQPALHVIVVTAQGQPSAGGKYRLRMTDKMIDGVLETAEKRDAIVFLDIQVGQSTLQEELPELEKYLKLPQVHLGIDPEFSMKNGGVPGRRIGTYDAADINYATQYLADLTKEHNLPPKILVVHRFTEGMVTNTEDIKLRPEVQVVMHMDGWGGPTLKRDTYRRYIQKEPVQFTGFKIFYKNDIKRPPGRLMTPEEVLALEPEPLYIQYQ